MRAELLGGITDLGFLPIAVQGFHSVGLRIGSYPSMANCSVWRYISYPRFPSGGHVNHLLRSLAELLGLQSFQICIRTQIVHEDLARKSGCTGGSLLASARCY